MLQYSLSLFLVKLSEQYPKWDFIQINARKYVWIWKKEKLKPENETLYCFIDAATGDIYRPIGDDGGKAKKPSGDIWHVINNKNWSFCKEEGICNGKAKSN